MKRRIKAVAAVLLILATVTACGGNATGGSATTTNRTTAGERDNSISTAYPDKVAGFQTEKPAAGEEIAVIHTDKGDLYMRLFPEAAPLAVENFVALAKRGYYNETTFHYVMENFLVQAGDPTGTGQGGESATGEPFGNEFDAKLLNLYGAVAMAGTGDQQNGSQFYINQRSADYFSGRENYSPEAREQYAKAAYESYLEEYTAEWLAEEKGITGWQDLIEETYVYDWIPDEVWEAYETYGGNVHLDGAYRRSGGHTVFGQIFQGMDVVDKIAAAVTDSNYKPVVDICIQSVEITTYQGE